MITEREKFAGNPTNGEAQLPIRKAFMTRDDIFRIAVQAGARPSLSPELWDFWNIRNADLERFVALVAAHEREECAKACEAGVVQTNNWDASDYNKACEIRAAAIRNRGEK